MSKAEFTAFLSTVFSNLADASASAASRGSKRRFIADCGLGIKHRLRWRDVEGRVYGLSESVFSTWPTQASAAPFILYATGVIGEIVAAGTEAYTEFKNLCVWAKTNGGMGSLYRSQHELVFVFKSGTASHINNVELGKHGRYRTNVWSYAGINSFREGRDEELALHPTVKPVGLVADAILDCSKRGGIVLDAFAGSGTTLVAAERTGRKGYGIELDPKYCDTIVKRLDQVAKLDATHAETGKTFAELETDRATE